MASIVKRKKKYSVVYTYTDENGNKRQKWETFDTNAEANTGFAEIDTKRTNVNALPNTKTHSNSLFLK